MKGWAIVKEYAAPTGLKFYFGFWFYKYAAPTALGTNAVPKSFCVGRLGQVAFEFLRRKVIFNDMNKLTNTHKRGMIGFFDVLGYKAIQKNIPIVEAISVVELIQKVIEKHQNKISPWSEIFGTNFGDHVVISDSIIAFAPFEEDNNEKNQADMFLPFCGEIVNDLFWAGLPVRGALAYGDFFIQKTRSGIYLAGKPIVESHDLANSLGLSGCVICESAEKFLTSQPAFKDSDNILRFMKHSVPLRNGKHEKLFILNQFAFFDLEQKITRQILTEKFAAFNKPIDSDVERKVVNTWEFFVACKPELASLAEPTNLLT